MLPLMLLLLVLVTLVMLLWVGWWRVGWLGCCRRVAVMGSMAEVRSLILLLSC